MTIPTRFYLVFGNYKGDWFLPEHDARTMPVDQKSLHTAIDQFDDGIDKVILIDTEAGTSKDVTEETVRDWLYEGYERECEVGPAWAYELLGDDRDETARELGAEAASTDRHNASCHSALWSR
jgi:hypothetical protein